MKKPIAKMYRRNLAAADPKLGWREIPDCPMYFFTRVMGQRALDHPEKDVPTVEYRAQRLVSDRIWHSSKIRNVRPVEWVPEYTWLIPLAHVDGTFEMDAHDIWSRAYASTRQDWTPEKVEQLLAEFERVGLLLRAKDTDGKVWGFWVGADAFRPPPSARKHYKVGKRHLFPTCSEHVLNNPMTCSDIGESGVGVGVGGGLDSEKDLALASDLATKSSETEQPKQVKSVCDPSPTPKPTPQNRRQKQVLSADEYAHKKEQPALDAVIAEFAAEIAARPICADCGIKHGGPNCGKPPIKGR